MLQVCELTFFYILILFLSSTKQKANGATQKENEVISMLEFFIYNIFVAFGGIFFSTNQWHFNGKDCAPLLVDLFVYSYNVEFIIKTNDLQTLKSLISGSGILMMFCQSIIQTLLIVFHYYTPKEFEIKETTVPASFLDIYLIFDTNGQLLPASMAEDKTSILPL